MPVITDPSLAWPILAAIVSALVSAGLMLATAVKWQLPRRAAAVGIALVAVLVAAAFAPAYRLLEPAPGRIPAALGWLMLAQVLVSGAGGLALLLLRFWRDPERVPPETEGVVLAAADGEVAYVWRLPTSLAVVVEKGGRRFRLDELTAAPFTAGPVCVIGIGMTFLDVHVNRCPVRGQVLLTCHISGRFLSLRRAEAPFVNERLTTVIEGGADDGAPDVAVVQIASRLVRRIDGYLQAGETVAPGQRLGMIRFGSLVAVVIPDRPDVQLQVRPGDRVAAGLTVLARFTGAGGPKPAGEGSA